MKIRWISTILALSLVLSITAVFILPNSEAAMNVESSISFSPQEQQPLWSYQAGEDVASVSISSDGGYIAAGSWDGNVYLFSRTSGTPLWSYRAGGGVLVSMSSDGNRLVAGGHGLWFFSCADNTPLWSWQDPYTVHSVSISSDGSYIAVGTIDVYLFSSTSSKPLWGYYPRSTLGNAGSVSVSISSDGSYTAAGAYIENKIYLFSRKSSTPLWSYTTGDFVWSIAISSDGNYIAASSAGNDKKVYLFSRTSSTPLWSYQAGGSVGSVAISAGGNYIVAGGEDNKIYLFSRASNIPLWTYDTHGEVRSVSISSDGSYIVAGSGRPGLHTSPYNKVYWFSRADNTPLWSCQVGSWVNSVDISLDGRFIVAGSARPDDRVYFFSRITSLTITPSSFVSRLGENKTLTATLALDGVPLAGKTITWSASAGSVVPENGVTNSGGQVTVTYTAPDNETTVTLTASFAGDTLYAASSENSLGTIAMPYSTLTISPRNFGLLPGENKTLTATLTCGGDPLENKLVTWYTTWGRINPLNPWSETDYSGQIFAVFEAPSVYSPISIRISASFAGEYKKYSASNDNSFCTLFFALLTFNKPDGTALADTEIYYGSSSDQVANYLGTTDNEGKIGLENSNLGGQTIYFKTSDGKFAGYSSIGLKGGKVTAELAEVSEFPIMWIIIVMVIITIAIGVAVLVKKKIIPSLI